MFFGIENVFNLKGTSRSLSVLICLEGTPQLPLIHKAALFDAPRIINGFVSSDFTARYEK